MGIQKFREVNSLQDVRLMYPRHVCIVGVQDPASPEKSNFMPASWNSPISFSPPIYGVAVAPERFTFRFLEKSGAFSISFFPYTEASRVHWLGSVSGAKVSKSRYIPSRPGTKLPVPIPLPAFLSLECQLLEMRPYGDHHWVVGNVRVAHYDPAICQDPEKGRSVLTPDLNIFQPLLYFGRGIYTTFSLEKTRKITRKELEDNFPFP